MIRLIGKHTYNMVQRKSDKDIKVVYKLDNNNWNKVFEGCYADLIKFVKKLKRNADRSERQNLIADLCGVSYACYKRDMGM